MPGMQARYAGPGMEKVAAGSRKHLRVLLIFTARVQLCSCYIGHVFKDLCRWVNLFVVRPFMSEIKEVI